MNLLEELKNLTSRLDESGIDYALCGGLALAVYARPRATLDIDIMIESDFLTKTGELARDLGYTLDAAPMEFKNGSVVIHRLTKVDGDTGEVLMLDLLIVTPATRKAWQSRRAVEWDDGQLKVLSPKGLVYLKSLRGSGQDRDDIDYLRSIDDED